ncbi:MAG: amidohydrolase family protein [Deltaproteobacteria bacterium]|nr:amidohydrolase family protein [Deltaproteobacteria bacterium]
MSEHRIAPDAIVDMHAHLYPEGCFDEVLKARPEFALAGSERGLSLTCRGSHTMSAPVGETLADRLRTMDEAGVGVEVLSIGALNTGLAGDGDVALARRVNDGLAEACREYPDRFRFVAALPWSRATDLVEELDRAMGLGAVGAGITTTVGEHTLDAPELCEFWREAQRRKLLVLVHPTFPLNGPADDRGEYLAVGYLGETAMAATKLTLGGVLEECPDVRVVWSHCGGSLCMVLDRIDRGYRRYEKCLRPPGEYLRQSCYFDTVSLSGPALDCARDTFGANRLVYGTDEPHVRDASRAVLAALRARPWPAAELDAILGGTARGLLGEG